MSYSQMQSASTKLNSAVLHNFNFFSYHLYNTKTRLFNQSACIIQYAFCHAWHLNFFRFFEDHLSSEKLLYF